MNNVMAAQAGWSYTDSDWLLDEHGKFEIINGGLYLTPWLSPAHQDLSAGVFVELSAFAKRERVGRVLFRPPLVFADADYLVPDIAVFPGRRAPYASAKTGPLVQLVVEVLSEFTETRDRGIKRECYARHGIPEYWIVDPFRPRIEVYRLQEDADQPIAVADRVRWQPAEGGAVLELVMSELLSDLE
ncbi:Uma2 family endonuclease [Longimicrobium sp.]|uniref:Uma2 family endonuclease n=1 Tax=Longimicrobium sp. TaxID=2029185 RepID=UPI003B3A89CA